MPQLNRDILREILFEIVKEDDTFRNIDKFMMAGKEPFNLVFDHCIKAKDVVITNYGINAKFPNMEYAPSYYNGLPVTGTRISARMLLFKPISNAIASTLTSLDIRGFSSKLIPMLKSIDQEMEELNIRDYNGQLKLILEACANISNVRNGVTIKVNNYYNQAYDMKFFAIPCCKLTMKRTYFNTIYNEMNFDNPYLRQKIRDLTIHGEFDKTDTFYKELKDFAAFLSIFFPNVENLDVKFKLPNHYTSNFTYKFWDWNSIEEMANLFKGLPPRIQGCICFKIINPRFHEPHPTQYTGVQRVDNEYYKIVLVTDTLTFKLAYWYFARRY